MLVVGRTQELKIATTLNEANELLNEGWSLLDAKIVSATEFVLLMAWYGRPRQEIHRLFSELKTSIKNGQNGTP